GAEGDAALRGANKIHHLDYFGREIAGFLESLDCKLEILARAEERCESVPERMNRLRRNSRALESNDVDPAQRMGAVHDAERRHVAAGTRQTAHHRQPPDASVLMHDAVARDQRAIAELDPAGEQRTAGDDGRAADSAIVRNVRVLHHEVVVAHDGDGAALAAAMDGGIFAEDVSIADFHRACATGVSQILRLVADYSARMKHVVGAEFRDAENRDVTD